MSCLKEVGKKEWGCEGGDEMILFCACVEVRVWVCNGCISVYDYGVESK